MHIKKHIIIPATLLLLLVSGCFNSKRPYKEAKDQVTAPVELLIETDAEEDTLVVEEVDPPIVHIIYKEKVHGFSVSIDLIPEEIEDELWLQGPAKLFFSSDDTSFVIENERFYLGGFNKIPYQIKITQDTTFFPKYIHRPQGKLLFDDSPFYFADMDFDGEDELVIVLPLWGPRGSKWYQVFELDGTERKDRPIREIDSQTTFNRRAGTIKLDYYHGIMIGSVELEFKHQGNGRFALTDSTRIFYGTDFTDSIRYHYRVVDGEMVLYETIKR